MSFITDLKGLQDQAIAAAAAEKEEVGGKLTGLQTKLTEAERLVTEGGTVEEQTAALAAAQTILTEIQGIYTPTTEEPPV